MNNITPGHVAYFQGSPGAVGFEGRIHNISVKRLEAPNANVTCEV